MSRDELSAKTRSEARYSHKCPEDTCATQMMGGGSGDSDEFEAARTTTPMRPSFQDPKHACEETVLSLLRCDTKTLEPSRPCLSRTKSPSRISFALGVGRLAVPGLGDPSTAPALLASLGDDADAVL